MSKSLRGPVQSTASRAVFSDSEELPGWLGPLWTREDHQCGGLQHWAHLLQHVSLRPPPELDRPEAVREGLRSRYSALMKSICSNDSDAPESIRNDSQLSVIRA